MTALFATLPMSYAPRTRALSVLQVGAGWFPEFCAGGENVFYHLAKHLPATGWTPIILCVDEAYHEQPLDPELAALARPNEGPIRPPVRLRRK